MVSKKNIDSPITDIKTINDNSINECKFPKRPERKNLSNNIPRKSNSLISPNSMKTIDDNISKISIRRKSITRNSSLKYRYQNTANMSKLRDQIKDISKSHDNVSNIQNQNIKNALEIQTEIVKNVQLQDQNIKDILKSQCQDNLPQLRD